MTDWGKLSDTELAMFKRLKNVRIVFDVGARDNLDYLEIKPNATYHLFEPNPEFVELLKAKVGNCKRIVVNNYGLGDVAGEFDYDAGSQAFTGGKIGTLTGPKISVKTLDWYIETNNIRRIDFLKIDAEGYDYKILQGGTKAIQLARYIQVEHWNDIGEFQRLLTGFEMEEIGGRNLLFTKI
jgi:FkbM family methyltransferase